jgi:hypothetical protein
MLGPQARDQIAIELAAPQSYYPPPRFRALPLFERRPHERVQSLVLTGIRNRGAARLSHRDHSRHHAQHLRRQT